MALPRGEVLVGIPATKTERRDHGITNAALGYIHETGAPEVNIPPRPFLIPGIREAKDRITVHLAHAARLTLEGDADGAEKAMHRAGIVAASAVKNKITVGPFVPLKPSTIRRRRIRSAGSKYRRKATGPADVRPLIDTGQLRNSITYVVRGQTSPFTKRSLAQVSALRDAAQRLKVKASKGKTLWQTLDKEAAKTAARLAAAGESV